MEHRPYFSIIMPAYNRETLIRRAISSCLSQDCGDFELLVVDDASTDATAAVVERFEDRRIRLLRHEVNRGVCAARNSGLDAATGKWVTVLDSDDEFLPGALAIIHQRTQQVGERVGALAFRCQWDTGIISPENPMAGEPMDYEAYLRWLESSFGTQTEYKICIRADAAATARYASGRVNPAGYNLDIASRFMIQGFDNVVRMYWHDADNQLCVEEHARKKMANAADWSALFDGILSRHGDGLRRWAPRWHRQYLGASARSRFYEGRRLAGLLRALQCIALQPLSPAAWAVALIGPISPSMLARIEVQKASQRRKMLDSTRTPVGVAKK